MNDLTQTEIINLVIFGLVGLYLASTITRLFRGRLLTGFITLGFWAVALFAVVTGYSYRSELRAVTVDRRGIGTPLSG